MSNRPSLPRTPMVERLDARLLGPHTEARIDASEFAALLTETGLAPADLLVACLAWAQRWAVAPISNFQVGAAALASSGAVYLGANLEFRGLPLAQTVHAEQSAIAHAWSHGERTLTTIATSAAPCGFCRQFMLELAEPPSLVLADFGSITLAELLPRAFGPTQLGRAPELLRSGPHGLALIDAAALADPLCERALGAANRSSAPYSGALAGVALGFEDGGMFDGSVLESAAYNPTLAPMQAALIVAHHGGARLAELEQAVLVELDHPLVSQLDAARALLTRVAPNATLRRLGAVKV